MQGTSNSIIVHYAPFENADDEDIQQFIASKIFCRINLQRITKAVNKQLRQNKQASCRENQTSSASLRSAISLNSPMNETTICWRCS